MKKMYIICFLVVATIAAAAYVVSFRYGYQISSEDEVLLESELNDWTKPVSIEGEDVITRRTAYVIENFDMTENSLNTEELFAPTEVLGYNRSRLCEYLQEYMQDMPQNEKEAGLLSYELKEFTQDKVVLRKTYKDPDPTYLYYFDVQLGHVVVCNAEDGSLYAYTEIKFQNLPENIQQEILNGKYISTVTELYEFLEAYSS